MTVLDFSAGPPSAKSIKQAGHLGVMLYCSPARPGEEWMTGKAPSKEYLESLEREGIRYGFIWQFRRGGSMAAGDAGRGFNGGVHDARESQKYLDGVGRPDLPVIFAIDWDITLHEWNHYVRKYFEGAISVLGKQRVGLYGHSRVAHWAGPDNKLIAEVAPGRYFSMVTRSWGSIDGSGNPRGRSYSVLFQGTHNVPGPDGVQVDINTTFHEDWGWRPFPGANNNTGNNTPVRRPVTPPIKKHPGWHGDPTWLPAALRAFGVNVVEDPGWDKWGNGDFKSIWGVVTHHTGSNHTSTGIIRHGHSALRGLLSQIHLDRKGKATLVGVGVAWHAGVGSWRGLPTNNANWHTIGIEPQSDGTSPWPPEQMDAYYRICAAICWVLDVNSDRVIAHHEWGAIQGKWDQGAGIGIHGAKMNMTTFRENVQHYIDYPPFAEDEEIMTAFDQIERRYTTRADDSGFEGRPIDYLLNADAHAFVARVNTVEIIDEMRENNKLLKENNERLDRIEQHLTGKI